jgi:hypothetical protein
MREKCAHAIIPDGVKKCQRRAVRAAASARRGVRALVCFLLSTDCTD